MKVKHLIKFLKKCDMEKDVKIFASIGRDAYASVKITKVSKTKDEVIIDTDCDY